MKEQLESIVLQMYKEPACDALKRCGSFKRLSSSRCSRIKEGISARLPRNSACTGILYGERSKIWILTLGRHEQPGGTTTAIGDSNAYRCGDRQLKLSAKSLLQLQFSGAER